MGWLWGNSAAPSGTSGAYDTLDPKLKEFLDEETRTQQSTSRSQPHSSRPADSQPSATQSYSERLGLISPFPNAASAPIPLSEQAPHTHTGSAAVPPESLFQDGRYAHLWRTYQSPTALAHLASSTPSQDALSTLVDSYKARSAAASRAALENCVLERIAENDCLFGPSGGWGDRLRGCREESRRFNRCFEMQTRLLRGMGYMDLDEQEGEGPRERMRMRADEVWTEISRREAEVKRAREEGREEPQFEPLREFGARGRQWMIKKPMEQVKAEVEGEEAMLSRFKPEAREELRARIKDMPAYEKELELKLEYAEATVHRKYTEEISKYYQLELDERRQRQKEGKSTFGDWLKRIGGWKQ